MRQAIVSLVGLTLLVAAGAVHGQDFAIDSFFDVFTAQSVTEGPPYPSQPPIRIAAYGGGMYLEDIELEFFGPGSDPFDNLIMDAADSGGMEGNDPGDAVALAVRLPNGDFDVDSFFDITYRIDWHGPEHAIKNVALPSGDFAVDSFFDITYQIEFEDGTQATRGVRGTLSPGQEAVTGISGGVQPSDNFSVDSFFDISYQIEFSSSVPVDPNLPLLDIQLNGGHTPEPSTFILLATGALGLFTYGWRRRCRGQSERSSL